MTIPELTTRVQVRGHFPAGEIFEWGYWLGGAPTDQDEANNLADLQKTLFDSSLKTLLLGHINADSGYDEIRVYAYPSGGPTASFVGQSTLNYAGTGSTTSNNALQIALVVTLLTGEAGRRKRGRLYLPYHLTSALTNHQLSVGTVPTIATAFADFCGGQNVGQQVSVVSQVGAGQQTPVTAVKVDSKLDTQRRRSKKQTPQQSSTVAVTVG